MTKQKQWYERINNNGLIWTEYDIDPIAKRL